jgi:hypothetical protein
MIDNRECFDFSTKRTGACRLHAYWDSNLVKAAMKGLGEKGMVSDLTAAKVDVGGDARSWAAGSNELAKSIAYNFEGFSCGAGKASVNLPERYDAQAVPVVNQQLTLAGQRLAATLNMIFDPAKKQ